MSAIASLPAPVLLPHPSDFIWQRLMTCIANLLQQRGWHPARTLVLLPYMQLLPLAQQHWAASCGNGLSPRFETTQSWAQRLGSETPLGSSDITFDAAQDHLTAQALLHAAGLMAVSPQLSGVLAGNLLDYAYSLATQAAATAPAQRFDWAARARQSLAASSPHSLTTLEQQLADMALAWVSSSAYASDVLFGAAAREQVDGLVVLRSYSAALAESAEGGAETVAEDALQTALLRAYAPQTLALSLEMPAASPLGRISLHRAMGAEDEAERAAACVLRAINAGQVPVALVANDRSGTRRIRALLANQQVNLRDESGWQLSTTRAGAQVMAALLACAPEASSDAVLDWLKNSPAWAGGGALPSSGHAPPESAVLALEQKLREAGAYGWRAGAAMFFGASGVLPETAADVAPEEPMSPAVAPDRAAQRLVQQVQALLQPMQAARPMLAWLSALQALLQASGQWQALQSDSAGAQLLAALHLSTAAQAELQAGTDANAATAARRIRLGEFTAWVNQALEAASFRPEAPAQGAAQVVILPLRQLLARPFAAVVMPGCDEQHLPAMPVPPGPWTAAQRALLGLPSRAALALGVRAAWQQALQMPQCDLLWRSGDARGEPLQASPLLQLLQLEAPAPLLYAADPRELRRIKAAPTAQPQPSGAALPLLKLSASQYQDLRHCPYRFFALRQLALRPADELLEGLDKRDFGLWLHAVLGLFHQQLQAAPVPPPNTPIKPEESRLNPAHARYWQARTAMLDIAAERTTSSQGLNDADFLPFAASWPAVRDGYLDWLAGYEASGAVFEAAEVASAQPLGPLLTLVGRIDRVDRMPQGHALLLDYKTESAAKTGARLKRPTEDTQLAFYAALLPDDQVESAYVNVGERDGSKTFAQEDMTALRDGLLASIQHDMAAIRQGAPLRALGEGSACEYCAARGLCRKDFWAEPVAITDGDTERAAA